MTAKRAERDSILAEFEKVELGDARLERRLAAIVSQIASAPADSFPEQMESTAEREALYRFLSNPRVVPAALLAGHIEETIRRARRHSLIRVLHDTTDFIFEGERDGLGIIKGEACGFLGHFALAVGTGEEREPLGVMGLIAYIHQNTRARRGKSRPEQVAITKSLPREQKESSRWEKLAEAVSARLPDELQAIHVMDQEADDYTLLARLNEAKLRFVVRGSTDRITKSERQSIEEVMAAQPAKIFRTVRLNRRPKTRGRHAERDERDADLMIRWSKVVVPRPQYAQTDLRELHLNAVHVFEPNPPSEAERVEWLLLTSERVDTLEDATVVVDHYRARWLVEEYFKALKTGCAVEKRQLTTYTALLRALALFVPMAWRLLALRQLSRESTPKPAQHLFTVEQLRLLGAMLHRRDYQLPAEPSVRDALLGIAALGGHIRNNGDPGWIVLGRGFRKFVEAESIWQAARSERAM